MYIEYVEGSEGNGGHYNCVLNGKSIGKTVDCNSGLHALWLELGSPAEYTLVCDEKTGIVTKKMNELPKSFEQEQL